MSTLLRLQALGWFFLVLGPAALAGANPPARADFRSWLDKTDPFHFKTGFVNSGTGQCVAGLETRALGGSGRYSLSLRDFTSPSPSTRGSTFSTKLTYTRTLYNRTSGKPEFYLIVYDIYGTWKRARSGSYSFTIESSRADNFGIVDEDFDRTAFQQKVSADYEFASADAAYWLLPSLETRSRMGKRLYAAYTMARSLFDSASSHVRDVRVVPNLPSRDDLEEGLGETVEAYRLFVYVNSDAAYSFVRNQLGGSSSTILGMRIELRKISESPLPNYEVSANQDRTHWVRFAGIRSSSMRAEIARLLDGPATNRLWDDKEYYVGLGGPGAQRFETGSWRTLSEIATASLRLSIAYPLVIPEYRGYAESTAPSVRRRAFR